MKRCLIMSLLVFAGFILLSCGGKDLKSAWLEKKIEADGSGSDWKDIPLEYDEDLNLMYGITNNDTCICLLIKLNDPMLAGKIARRGMTIWFNDQDEKEKIFGIRYREEFSRDYAPGRFNAAGEESSEDLEKPKRRPMEAGPGVFLLVKSNGDAESLSGPGMAGLQAAADYDAGIYSYEFSVPLNRPFGDGMILSVLESNRIKSCLEIGGVSKEDMTAMKERMEGGRGSGRPGGMGGGRSGGGMGGMRPGGGKGRMPDMDGKEIWINVLLASQPQQ